ncbi:MULTISPECIES: adenylate/guanylate cyclase domain-containing protein [Agrobacterium]|jgi:adenylate cyclase|uniref:Adenylate cyclase n=3 Tax=Agrobacterium tumefaciens complex TaxID=1183400 RepID=Q7CZV6_AGRFC|nr:MULTISPECIES: adenylate/guanylate cyclase domain-containing protein [Agrobacterium]AAK13019.1 adenylate cyclase-like protein [Agrobacterium tumefaciens]AAK86953.1 adenylate cyclase [Agrobacterium fabrum str. C58]AYM56871.1 adenylate cyclase [Agrobacterium fabrum]AYM61950.1 adenylate cyclase [Agrobacterium fabrum]EGL65000.1 adenylate cyclase [Agrobacterium sp. ATCC 31749]
MRKLLPILDYVVLFVAVAGAGVAYAFLEYGGGALIGATYALFACAPILAFERGYILPGLSRQVSALPTPAYIAVGLIIYAILVFCGFGLGGTILWLSGIFPGTWKRAVHAEVQTLIFTLIVCGIIVFIMRVRELLGRDIFIDLILGRYRRPVSEDRVFIFIDLVGSTSFAETHGDLKAQEFLGEIFASYAAPVRRHGGVIDDYIGDAAIITWPYHMAIRRAACVRCVFDIQATMEEKRDMWLSRFGEVPRLRFAIHGGPVITAEIGVDHHKITYFGDTVNTTSRLESLSKMLGHPVLISADLAHQLVLPKGVRSEYLGEHAVKGRGQTLGVCTLSQYQAPAA